MTSTAKQRRKQKNTCNPPFGYKPFKMGVWGGGVRMRECAYARTRAPRAAEGKLLSSILHCSSSNVCVCERASETAGVRLRICIDTNGRRRVHGLRARLRVSVACARDSQLGGVLGNALGQRVQPSVAAAHHAVGARADVGTAGRREAAVILHI